MKELTIEQKAQRYDEALNITKNLISAGLVYEDAAVQIFPELAESEDERIRKEIITYLSTVDDKELIPYESWIAWLKKQGEQKSFARYKVGDTIYYDSFGRLVSFTIANIVEDGTDNPMYEDKDGNSVFQNEIVEQKPTDKVEPKFHEGEWLCENEPNYYARFIQILETVNVQGKERYRISRDIHNDEDIVEFRFIEDNWHPFNIKDAKDGDVLAAEDKDRIFLYNGKLDLRGRVCAYCGIYKTYDGLRFTECAIGNYFTDKEPHPATKEQRDLLFQKMKEAGYEWDAEKKELKKIEWEPQTGDTFRKKGTTSPTYHLCDKLEDGITFCFVENREVGIAGGKITIFALKRDYELVERLKPIEKVVEEEFNKALQTKVEQKSAEWNKQQVVNALTTMLTEKIKPLTKKVSDGTISCKEEMFRTALVEIRSFVNSPAFQIGKDDSIVWSEEDERMVTRIVKSLSAYAEKLQYEGFCHNSEVLYEQIDWLKSLKDRVQPQPKQESLKSITAHCDYSEYEDWT